MSSGFLGKTNDNILIQAMSEGDMGAFAEIYKRYAPGMRRFVAGMIKDRAKAEDIVQNIFMRLMTSRPAFENAAAFKNWLFVCARTVQMGNAGRKSGGPPRKGLRGHPARYNLVPTQLDPGKNARKEIGGLPDE